MTEGCFFKPALDGEYAEFDGWSSRFRRSGFLRRATARQLLALWYRLLNNFKLGKVLRSIGNGAFLGSVAHKARYIARANLHGPHWRLPLGLDNFCCARVFHGFRLQSWFWQVGALFGAIVIYLVTLSGPCHAANVEQLLTPIHQSEFRAPSCIESINISDFSVNVEPYIDTSKVSHINGVQRRDIKRQCVLVSWKKHNTFWLECPWRQINRNRIFVRVCR